LTNSGYMAVFGKGNSVSGSGNVLSVVSSMGAKSCNDLLSKDWGKKNKDGVYYINPTGTSSSSGIFQVYCDMTTDGGGWSLIVRIKADGTWNHGSGSSMGLLMNPSQNNLAKLSDVTINQIKSEWVFRLTCRDKTGYYKLVDGIWNSRHETTYGSNQILWSSSYVWSYIATGHDSWSSYGLSNYIYSWGINPFGWHQNYFPQSYPSEWAPNFWCYETTVGWWWDGVVWVK
jgi:hypothetical protein